jgi:AcrR family transcriptional regulator
MNDQDSARTESQRARASHDHNWRARRQSEILAAAFEEFAAKGYAEARLDDVAQRAGIAKGTIYLYFKSKERLFCAVLRGLVDHTFKEIEVFVRSFPGSAEELTRKVVSRQYAEIVKNPKTRSILRLLIAESQRFPQLSNLYLREVITPGLGALRSLVQKGVASGEFRRTKVSEFPQVLVGPVVLAIVWALIVGDQQPLDLDGYMKAHLDLLLHGLRTTTPDAVGISDAILDQGGRS